MASLREKRASIAFLSNGRRARNKYLWDGNILNICTFLVQCKEPIRFHWLSFLGTVRIYEERLHCLF